VLIVGRSMLQLLRPTRHVKNFVADVDVPSSSGVAV
jgi:hypothetical protein